MEPTPATNATPPPTRCALCRTPVDPATALYGDAGQICDACGAREDMRANLLRSVKSSGYGTLGPAVVSWLFNPLFALTAAAVISAVWTFKGYASQDPDDREFLSNHRGPMIAAIVGLVIAALPAVNLFAVLARM